MTIESPVPNDSVTPGVAVGVQVHATDADGIDAGAGAGPGRSRPGPRSSTRHHPGFRGTSRDLVFTTAAVIPPDAPGRTRITISASAVDGNRQPGSANADLGLHPQRGVHFARRSSPRTVPARSERTDTIMVTANGAGHRRRRHRRSRQRRQPRRPRQRAAAGAAASPTCKQRHVALRLPVTHAGPAPRHHGVRRRPGGRTGYAVRRVEPLAGNEPRARRGGLDARSSTVRPTRCRMPGSSATSRSTPGAATSSSRTSTTTSSRSGRTPPRRFDPNGIRGRLVALGPVRLRDQSRHAARRELGRHEHQPRVHRLVDGVGAA